VTCVCLTCRTIILNSYTAVLSQFDLDHTNASVHGEAVQLSITVNGSPELVPMTATVWLFREEHTELWTSLIANFSTDNRTDFERLKWKCTDYTAAGQHAITQFKTPQQVQVVTTTDLSLQWFLPVDELQGHGFGVALYTLPCFPPMGFSKLCIYACEENDKFKVCDFTVRTLGCAQPSKRTRLS
jgi:hypothetical protein